jgi:hypothetical protein
VKGKDGDSMSSEEQVSERMRKTEEREKADEEERKEKDSVYAETRIFEVGLEEERKEKVEKQQM